jgi:hypothetical protein
MGEARQRRFLGVDLDEPSPVNRRCDHPPSNIIESSLSADDQHHVTRPDKKLLDSLFIVRIVIFVEPNYTRPEVAVATGAFRQLHLSIASISVVPFEIALGVCASRNKYLPVNVHDLTRA